MMESDPSVGVTPVADRSAVSQTSQSVITDVSPSEEPNLWEEICKEFEEKRTGRTFTSEPIPPKSLDPEGVASTLADILSQSEGKPSSDDVVVEGNTHDCMPRDFLEKFIFPTLLPAMEAMLRQAKLEKCFERKRTKFNALDFLTEYLYTQNPLQYNRERKDLWDIPFVIEWLKEHPRQPLPLSLIWTEPEAAVVIQSQWRGYKVRCEPEIQELRHWQREWRDMNGTIHQTVNEFWEKKINRLESRQSTDEDRASMASAASRGGATPNSPNTGMSVNKPTKSQTAIQIPTLCVPQN